MSAILPAIEPATTPSLIGCSFFPWKYRAYPAPVPCAPRFSHHHWRDQAFARAMRLAPSTLPRRYAPPQLYTILYRKTFTSFRFGAGDELPGIFHRSLKPVGFFGWEEALFTPPRGNSSYGKRARRMKEAVIFLVANNNNIL